MLSIYPKFEGLPIIPSRHSLNELMQCNLLLEDVVSVLSEGFDCYRSKREKGTLEKCVRKGKKKLMLEYSEIKEWRGK